MCQFTSLLTEHFDYDCPLAGNARRIFMIFFLLFNSVTSAITAYNVDVFKKT